MSNRAQETDHALVKVQEAPEEMSQPRGMTIDELHHQRALLAIKKEFCKDKTLRSLDKLKHRLPFNDGAGGTRVGLRNMAGIASRVMSGLSYLDYALMGISAFNMVRKVTGIFRRHKR